MIVLEVLSARGAAWNGESVGELFKFARPVGKIVLQRVRRSKVLECQQAVLMS